MGPGASCHGADSGRMAPLLDMMSVKIRIMQKIRQFLLLCSVVVCCACNSDKGRIQSFLDNFHPDAEVEIEGDINVDSTFCPLAALDSASLVLMANRMNLLHLLEVNPDSAFILARQLNQKYGGEKAFADIAYPKGPDNRLSYQVKCIVDGRERYIVFYKNLNDDAIENSSLEVDEAVDSLMSSFTMLRNGLNIILNDSRSPADKKPKAEEEKKKKTDEGNSDAVEEKRETTDDVSKKDGE